MTATERRAEIMRILTVRRSETAARLAVELGVSPSTIYRDILALTAEYPLDTRRGNGGCVSLAEWYHPHRSILTREQQQVIMSLSAECDDYRAHVLRQLLAEYGSPEYRTQTNHKELTFMGKILLTGGAGYIGAHTCVELLNAGYDIVVVDNYYNSTPESLRRVSELTGKKFSVYEADVCDRAVMDDIFTKEPIEAVIHFAGYKAVGESVAKPVMYYRNNLDATRLRHRRRRGLPRGSEAHLHHLQPVRLHQVHHREDTRGRNGRQSRLVHRAAALLQSRRRP